MKLEIEIPEDEIRKAAEHTVCAAIASRINQWDSAGYIKQRVKAAWTDAVDKMIVEVLSDSRELHEKIVAQVERQLRAKLAAVQKVSE